MKEARGKKPSRNLLASLPARVANVFLTSHGSVAKRARIE
jgi:hypothetical protein